METSSRGIELMQHALGINENQREPYRNYFLAGPGHNSNADLETLVSGGMMTKEPAPAFCAAGEVVYSCTCVGKTVALLSLPAPKIRRRTAYEQYLDGEYSGSFTEFLLGRQAPEFEEKIILSDFCKTSRVYRMFRKRSGAWSLWDERDVEGEWCTTRKEAKASYKAALKTKRRGHERPNQADRST